MKKKITRGVSWTNVELLEAARKKSHAIGLSFSAYINQLVRKDLGWTGTFSQETNGIKNRELLQFSSEKTSAPK